MSSPPGDDIFFAFVEILFSNQKKFAAALHLNQKISCRAPRADPRVTPPNPSQANNFQGHTNHEG
jgi:hypothetical protein